MPRQVDHEQRRRQIARAVWAIVATRGLEAVSLRDVAAEAGVSMGMVQHYFRTKDEMLHYACRSIVDTAAARLDVVLADGGGPPAPATALRALFVGTLPLTPEQRVGTSVWYAFMARAVVDEALGAIIREAWHGTHDFVVAHLRAAQRAGQVPAVVDPDRAAVELVALVDGLVSHLLVGQITNEQAVAAVDEALGRLFDAGALRD